MAQLFDGQPGWFAVATAGSLVLAAAYLCAQLAGRMARGILGPLLIEDGSGITARQTVRTIRIAVFVLVAAVLSVPALQMTGVDVRAGARPEMLAQWLLGPGLRVLLIAVCGYVIVHVEGVVVQRFQRRISQGAGLDMMERAKRARTLGNLIQNVVGVTVVMIAGLMILRELDVDIMPVLTGAGIVGLAIGFGAQTLVKDVLAGFFLILENQVRVGDSVVINGTAGVVETINLRTIVLRDVEGAVHIFPNGGVNTLANRSLEFAYAVVDVPIPLAEDPDRASAALSEIAERLAGDEAFKPFILERPEILGLATMGTDKTILRLRIKTVPVKQPGIARELRRRIRQTFAERGIEMSIGRMTLMVERGKKKEGETH